MSVNSCYYIMTEINILLRTASETERGIFYECPMYHRKICTCVVGRLEEAHNN